MIDSIVDTPHLSPLPHVVVKLPLAPSTDLPLTTTSTLQNTHHCWPCLRWLWAYPTTVIYSVRTLYTKLSPSPNSHTQKRNYPTSQSSTSSWLLNLLISPRAPRVSWRYLPWTMAFAFVVVYCVCICVILCGVLDVTVCRLYRPTHPITRQRHKSALSFPQWSHMKVGRSFTSWRLDGSI